MKKRRNKWYEIMSKDVKDDGNYLCGIMDGQNEDCNYGCSSTCLGRPPS